VSFLKSCLSISQKETLLWNDKIHYRVRDTDESILHQGFQNGLCPSRIPIETTMLYALAFTYGLTCLIYPTLLHLTTFTMSGEDYLS